MKKYRLEINEAIFDELKELINLDGEIKDDGYQDSVMNISTDKFDRGGSNPPTDTDDFVNKASQKMNYFFGQGIYYLHEDTQNSITSLDSLSKEYNSPELEADIKSIMGKFNSISDENKGDVFAIILQYMLSKVGVSPQAKQNIVKMIK